MREPSSIQHVTHGEPGLAAADDEGFDIVWDHDIAPRWSIKGEYLYYDLGTETVNNGLATVVGEVSFFAVSFA